MSDTSTATLSPDAQKAWEEIVASADRVAAANLEYYKLREGFFRKNIDHVATIRSGLKSKDWRTAVVLASGLDDASLKELFPDLIRFAGFVHGLIQFVRNLILRIPKDWLVANIEQYADPLIEESCEDDYRRFLELYDQIDEGLMRRLAERALRDKDPGVREAGQDFLSD